jgi:hypothetical protein
MVGIHPDHGDSYTDVCAWRGCIIDIISRPDLRQLAKRLWILFVLLLPVGGPLVYVIARAVGLRQGPPALNEE